MCLPISALFSIKECLVQQILRIKEHNTESMTFPHNGNTLFLTCHVAFWYIFNALVFIGDSTQSLSVPTHFAYCI